MITVAVQKGSYVYVYGEGNKHLFSREGTLYGFTSTTVSVRRGNTIFTYDNKGCQISSHLV